MSIPRMDMCFDFPNFHHIENEDLKQKLVADALTPILSAMENEDGTLMADLITYELVELLDSL